LLYGYWSFLWAGFGAFVPYLRSQFHIDYATASLHFSGLALGPFISGFFGDKIIARLGLARTVAAGVGLMVVGLWMSVAGTVVASTVGGAFLIGFGGNLMSQSVTASMSNRFGRQRAIGILEIQTVGTVFTFLAPLTISSVVKLGYDWRVAFLSSISFILVLAYTSGRSLKQFGHGQVHVQAESSTSSLPAAYWIFFGIIFLSVASEWAVTFWCPEFFAQELHLSKPDAALGMSVFVLAMLIGRISGGLLLRQLAVSRLLALSASLAAFGFLLFWLARALPLNLLGLLIMGLGESNVYPNCLSQALAAASRTTEKAAARMSLSTGGATLLAPLLLGLLADRMGIARAYGFVAVCLILAAAVLSSSKVKCAD
jgi:fucose permease